MKLFSGLVLAGCLLLPSCGREACANLPVCLNPPPSESQPYGGVSDPRKLVEISPGQSRDVPLTISRVGMPQDEPVFLIAEGGSQGENSLLARTPDGAVSITGDTRPFTGDTTTVSVHVTAEASVTGGVQTLRFPIRKQSSKYPTPGWVNVSVFVR